MLWAVTTTVVNKLLLVLQPTTICIWRKWIGKEWVWIKAAVQHITARLLLLKLYIVVVFFGCSIWWQVVAIPPYPGYRKRGEWDGLESESKFCIALVSCTSHQLSCKKRERETAFFLLAEKPQLQPAFWEIGTHENFCQKTATHLIHLIKLNK